MDSVWTQDVQLPRFFQLKGDLRTDVLVVGGGLAGLLCADRLSRSGIDCTLIEKDRLMCGVSGRTTAKLTSQHGVLYSKLLQKFGAEKARLYWRANEDALAAFRSLGEKADCDFQTQNSCLFATGSTETLEAELQAYEKLKIPGRWEKTLPLPFSVTGGLVLPDQGQLHPLKLAAYLAQGIKIYENTGALEFLGNRVRTPMGTVTADKIIIATHFPMLNKHGSYFLKLYQQRSYVVALENTKQPEGMYLDCAENGLSIRTAGRYLLLGGGGHRTGKQGLGWKYPELAAQLYYPQCRIVCRWATQDCMSLDEMPYIGQYSRRTPNLYAATGFRKWGMTGSMTAAMVLSDLIQGREKPYENLFSPSRSIFHRQLLLNGVEAVANLLRPTRPRCPHLGCALQWNAGEHSWDCSCHGSRFDAKGKLLNGPAADDMPHPPPDRS